MHRYFVATTAGGFQVPSPGGRMEGGLVPEVRWHACIACGRQVVIRQPPINDRNRARCATTAFGRCCAKTRFEFLRWAKLCDSNLHTALQWFVCAPIARQRRTRWRNSSPSTSHVRRNSPTAHHDGDLHAPQSAPRSQAHPDRSLRTFLMTLKSSAGPTAPYPAHTRSRRF